MIEMNINTYTKMKIKNDDLYTYFSNSLMTFGFNNLPENIHFTISENEKDKSRLNLHTTKNNGNRKKPRLFIVEIEKTTVEKYINSWSSSIFLKVLRELNIKDILSKNEVLYYPIDTMKDRNVKRGIKDEIKEILLSKTKVRGKFSKKYEYKGDFDDLSKSIIDNVDFLNLSEENLFSFKDYEFNETDYGLILYNDKCIFSFKIQEKWYYMSNDLTLKELVNDIIPPHLYDAINWKIKKSIYLLKKSVTYEDLPDFIPIELVIDENKRKEI